MRQLNLNELIAISGGNECNHHYSDAFLAGMKGVDYSATGTATMGGIAGAFFGGLLGAMSYNVIPTLVGSVCGAGIGYLVSLLIVNYEYHAGENYANVMKIVHG